MSQEQAAEAVGKSRGTIANWEKLGGEFEPRSDEVELLAKLYGLSTKDLRYADLDRGLTVTYADVVARNGIAAERMHERPAEEQPKAKTAKRGGRRKRAS